ncbi:MAG: 4a-hydroxytetrahydrobiopterin dehydratase [Kiritimatiellae bacterium]|nr:4a-hydroxytetrahydrobiopterin dehydratase [Kiritimatiellia bacterium]
MTDLASKNCISCEGDMSPMSEDQIGEQLKHIEGWEYIEGELVRIYTFKNYYQTVAFVNAAAWIAHQEDHHPDIEFGYKTCRIRYSTHAIGGISENDFICAAKINAL